MSFSSVFIRRPVATTLLTMGLALAGISAYFLLPVAPLPNVDLPTIFVSASMAGASPETMSTSVATPLERHLGTIADVSEMTSSSSVGSTRITLQFNLERDIDGAARDVQAAINAARADLPASLKSNPTYRKINPADQPVLILALTSSTLSPGQIYDSASTIVQQKLSQVPGIGQVQIGGSSLPAVRVDLNPRALFKYGIALEDVRAALSAANANAPKGALESGALKYQIAVNDQARTADQYRTLVVAYRDGAAVRLQDVARVSDGVEDVRNIGMTNGQPAIIVILFRQPGANIIETVENVKQVLPELQAAIPPSIKLIVANDRTGTIRASLHDVESTMAISVGLVVLVVFLFLRSGRAALIPSVAVPLSLVGTFGVMYLAGFTLDNLSLMALTVATGFVVDDAIVVLENVSRHIEDGMPRFEAALTGAREVGFTVLSMSLSLIAVFLPILLMGGIVGRFFNEFAFVLASAILISLVVSLTTTPMMCAQLDLHKPDGKQGRLLTKAERVFDWSLGVYDRSLAWALGHSLFVVFVLILTVFLNFYLYIIVPKGFFPSQDTGEIMGGIRGDQSISFQLMEKKFSTFVKIIAADPAVANVTGFSGGGGGGPRAGAVNSGNVFIQLKPLAQRGGMSTDEVIDRLRDKLGGVSGARLFLQAAQDIRAGGRQGQGAYQYTLQADTLDELNEWLPKITNALQDVPELEDVNSDREDKGLEVDLKIDRNTAARLGISTTQIDNTLYDAFGQRQVSTIYNDLNQYHVVMGVAPEFWQSPETLRDIYVSTSGGAVSGTAATGAVAGTTTLDAAETAADVASDTVRNQQLNALTNSARGNASTGASVSTKVETMVPLGAFSSFGPGTTPLSINHQGPFVAATFSFNLAKGKSLGEATAAIERTMGAIHVPVSIHGGFAGTAQIFQQSLNGEWLLILAAILAVYIVLGVLYESYVHPLTILSTLPSAGVGAVLALLVARTEFSLMALIGVILLIGIVKKNAIMMIDFALQAEREQELPAREAIALACHLRFRPIMMTTFAAILGALPLAIGFGTGAELRQPLGIAIVGGLAVSQVLTLYTTPVVYLYLDRFRLWAKRGWDSWYGRLVGDIA
ncbi:MAG: efflux RND transporter permease subunit [Alphaproteobacteria bacterium]|nr:efflux RND transporter permease subunit [Alphaproteobacteria bacterium]